MNFVYPREKTLDTFAQFSVNLRFPSDGRWQLEDGSWVLNGSCNIPNSDLRSSNLQFPIFQRRPAFAGPTRFGLAGRPPGPRRPPTVRPPEGRGFDTRYSRPLTASRPSHFQRAMAGRPLTASRNAWGAAAFRLACRHFTFKLGTVPVDIKGPAFQVWTDPVAVLVRERIVRSARFAVQAPCGEDGGVVRR